nr:MAG TPA: hypothetical protein [Caudoviricetes sp.]
MIVCISEFWLSALLLITKSYRAITFGYKRYSTPAIRQTCSQA